MFDPQPDHGRRRPQLSLLLKLIFSTLGQPVGELVPVRETAAQTHRWRQPLGNAAENCRLLAPGPHAPRTPTGAGNAKTKALKK